MLISVEQLSQNGELKRGCVADTNILFAATYDSDSFHEWALEVFEQCRKNQIPVFSNMNIRSEFIELNRRVLMAEALMDFYNAWDEELDQLFINKLTSLKRRIDDALRAKKNLKLSDKEIKEFRRFFQSSEENNTTPGWKWFCNRHFKPYIETVWDAAVKALEIQFLGTREIETKMHFDKRPAWSEMMNIIGETGMATADAMITNLFLSSKLPLIITADTDVRDALVDLAPSNKLILAP